MKLGRSLVLPRFYKHDSFLSARWYHCAPFRKTAPVCSPHTDLNLGLSFFRAVEVPSRFDLFHVGIGFPVPYAGVALFFVSESCLLARLFSSRASVPSLPVWFSALLPFLQGRWSPLPPSVSRAFSPQ